MNTIVLPAVTLNVDPSTLPNPVEGGVVAYVDSAGVFHARMPDGSIVTPGGGAAYPAGAFGALIYLSGDGNAFAIPPGTLGQVLTMQPAGAANILRPVWADLPGGAATTPAPPAAPSTATVTASQISQGFGASGYSAAVPATSVLAVCVGTEGDLSQVTVQDDGGRTWTLAGSQVGGTCDVGIWLAPAGVDAQPNVLVQGDGNAATWFVLAALNGVSIPPASAAGQAVSASPASATVTTPVPCLVLLAAMGQDSQGVYSADLGTTLVQVGNGAGCFGVGYVAQATAGDASPSLSLAGDATAGAAVILALPVAS